MMFRFGWMPKKSIELKYLIILVNVFHMFTIKVVFPFIKIKITGAVSRRVGNAPIQIGPPNFLFFCCKI